MIVSRNGKDIGIRIIYTLEGDVVEEYDPTEEIAEEKRLREEIWGGFERFVNGRDIEDDIAH